MWITLDVKWAHVGYMDLNWWLHIPWIPFRTKPSAANLLYSLWLRITVQWHRSVSTLDQVMDWGYTTQVITYVDLSRKMSWSIRLRAQDINSLWPSDTIWQHKSESTLVKVMACCLTAPSHYLNQCWLIISEVQWHPSESNFTRDASVISHWN